jgi:hypothetical protein
MMNSRKQVADLQVARRDKTQNKGGMIAKNISLPTYQIEISSPLMLSEMELKSMMFFVLFLVSD